MELSNQSLDLIKRWTHAKQAVQDAKHHLNSAECELANATNEAGAFFVPNDAKPDEAFNLWVGDGLLKIAKVSTTMPTYIISWRTEPSLKSKENLRIS